jgi:prepilin-type N-terminal cleavage/methylation domain-containing protein
MWRKLKRLTLRQWLRARLARTAARPDRQGFSLVEIMMVMVILAIGVLPIAVIQHRARAEVGEADRHTQAIAVAQMQVERLKSQGFGNIVDENGVSGNVTWVAQVANVSFGLDRLTVTASWQNKNVVESLTVSDLISMR